MDDDLSNPNLRYSDIARKVADDVIGRLGAMDRRGNDAFKELMDERFSQIHTDLKKLFTDLAAIQLCLAELSKQSSLNGERLQNLTAMAMRLDNDIHGQGGIVHRLRAVEKSQTGNEPIIAGAGKLVMAILLALVAAAMGFALRGGLGG